MRPVDARPLTTVLLPSGGRLALDVPNASTVGWVRATAARQSGLLLQACRLVSEGRQLNEADLFPEYLTTVEMRVRLRGGMQEGASAAPGRVEGSAPRPHAPDSACQTGATRTAFHVGRRLLFSQLTVPASAAIDPGAVDVPALKRDCDVAAHLPRLYVASCGLSSLKGAEKLLKADRRVTEVSNVIMASGSYGYLEASAEPDVARELAASLNDGWADGTGPIALASASRFAGEPAWFLRPILGASHAPVDARWTEQWPVKLLRTLITKGVPATESIRLCRRGGGVWLAGDRGAMEARRAVAGAAPRRGLSSGSRPGRLYARPCR